MRETGIWHSHSSFSYIQINLTFLFYSGFYNKTNIISRYFPFLQNRGLDNYEAVPYFPYRDDGQHIFHQIEAMVMDYLDM